MGKFSLGRDFNKVNWAATLQLNMMRTFFAGIIWAIVLAFSGSKGEVPIFAVPFIAPIAYICILPFLMATIRIIDAMPFLIGGRFIADIVIIIFPFAIVAAIALGDPFVFALQKFQPRLVPMQAFQVVNFVWCIFVLDPRKSERIDTF
jgi:hypothetical protein